MRVAFVVSISMVLYEPAISTGRHFASLPLHKNGIHAAASTSPLRTNRTLKELNLSKSCRASREHRQVCHRDASVSGNCRKIRQCGCRASACGTRYQLKEIGRSALQNGAIAAPTPVIYAVVLFRMRHAPHDYTARSRRRPDHSAAAAARCHDDDAAERARCATRAGGLARGRPAAAGDERGGHQGERRRRIPQRAGLPKLERQIADGRVLPRRRLGRRRSRHP